MKSMNVSKWVGVAILVAVTGKGYAAEPVMRDVATHDQLVVAMRTAEQKDPMKNLKPAKGPDPSVASRPKSLLAESDIIAFGGLATLVPKRAILQIPVSCKDRIKMDPGAKIVGWADFYAANRGWITTVEISREQAEGNQPLAEDTRKSMTKCRNLMVATYQGGPISLLAAKTPAPAPAPAKPAETPASPPAENPSPSSP